MELNDLKNSMINVITATIENYIQKYENMSAEVLLEQIKNDTHRISDIRSQYHIICNDIILLQQVHDLLTTMQFKIAKDEPVSIYGVYCDRQTLFVSEQELNTQDINRLTFVSMFELFMAFQDMFASGDSLKANAIYVVQCLNIIYNVKTMLDESIMSIVENSAPVVSFLKNIKQNLTNNDIIYLATKKQIVDRQAKVFANTTFCNVIDTFTDDKYKGIVLDLKLLRRYDITPASKHNIRSIFFIGKKRVQDICYMPSKICATTLAKQITTSATVIKEKFNELKLIGEVNDILLKYRT